MNPIGNPNQSKLSDMALFKPIVYFSGFYTSSIQLATKLNTNIQTKLIFCHAWNYFLARRMQFLNLFNN